MLICPLALTNSNLCHFLCYAHFLCKNCRTSIRCQIIQDPDPHWDFYHHKGLYSLQWPSLISSGLFRASLFSSNPLLSGNRVRSGDILLVVELQYCRQPSLHLGWGLESLRSPLSCKEEPSVRAVRGALLGSSWKLFPSVVQKYAGNYSSLLLYWGCQLQGQVVPFVSQ